jgi:predicted transcriptional regulator
MAEMKQTAIKQISKLNDKHALKEIPEHLSQLSSREKEKEWNLSQHYDQAKAQYGNALSKLA